MFLGQAAGPGYGVSLIPLGAPLPAQGCSSPFRSQTTVHGQLQLPGVSATSAPGKPEMGLEF